MDRLRVEIEPFPNDPDRWGVSLVNNAELMLPCLEAAGARSVVEVGAFAGDLTRVLLDWARVAGATVFAIDPSPQAQLEQLDADRDDLELLRATSLEALATMPVLPDAVIIDGDHNWFTVSEELRIIAERAGDGEFPLVLFHDVAWPHARRDDYFAPEQVPEEFRQRTVDDAGLFPGDPGTRADGLPYRHPAAVEGGPRNGVLTAIEDFAEQRPELQLAVVPSFFGFGALWPREAAWADAVERALEPWDRHPLLDRLEANRVLHLVSFRERTLENQRLRERLARQEHVLRKLLESGTFAVGERLSKLRHRGSPAYSKDEVRAVLGD
jgi:SAM-dependent methyltransferase